MAASKSNSLPTVTSTESPAGVRHQLHTKPQRRPSSFSKLLTTSNELRKSRENFYIKRPKAQKRDKRKLAALAGCIALILAVFCGGSSLLSAVDSGPATSTSGDIRFVEGFAVRAAVTLVADADGILQIDRTKPILIGSATAPPTDPPTDLPEPPSDPLAQQVSTLLAKAPTDQATRKAMASLYKTTGQLPLTDPQQVRQSTDLLVGALPLSNEWKKWNSDVASFAAALSIADLKRAWGLIAEGLE